ncbi:hypothetical protein BT63DRAFT_429125 [Microthyrium microscopicum]|uniref:Ubiquitin 3 binding protein But2 C-terminal domain-containing protein n=1 Tax=Microthyrium microscopicum TaxID=703497 RepID=A0A6A6TZC8_9PEZI|nr:hypothetical protein BT63DRAFT_429125 [Microthyrium microscopicum]
MKFTKSTTLLSTINLATAAPSPIPQIPSSGFIILPTAPSQYDISTGAIHYAIDTGKLTNTTTLLTFAYPAASAGQTCTFHLYLSASSVQTRSKNLDIFSSLQPATKSTTSWGPGNQRNVQLARVVVSRLGDVSYLTGCTQVGKASACPLGTVRYEVVGWGMLWMLSGFRRRVLVVISVTHRSRQEGRWVMGSWWRMRSG